MKITNIIEDGKVMTFGIGNEVDMLNFEDKKMYGSNSYFIT
jgi:hypothetical protein